MDVLHAVCKMFFTHWWSRRAVVHFTAATNSYWVYYCEVTLVLFRPLTLNSYRIQPIKCHSIISRSTKPGQLSSLWRLFLAIAKKQGPRNEATLYLSSISLVGKKVITFACYFCTRTKWWIPHSCMTGSAFRSTKI